MTVVGAGYNQNTGREEAIMWRATAKPPIRLGQPRLR
jgi:hypothetical protein